MVANGFQVIPTSQKTTLFRGTKMDDAFYITIMSLISWIGKVAFSKRISKYLAPIIGILLQIVTVQLLIYYYSI